MSLDKQEPGKSGRRSKLEKIGGMNISYGDTLPIGELVDVEEYGKGKAPKGLNLGQGKSKPFAKDKNPSGFMKARK